MAGRLEVRSVFLRIVRCLRAWKQVRGIKHSDEIPIKVGARCDLDSRLLRFESIRANPERNIFVSVVFEIRSSLQGSPSWIDCWPNRGERP